MAGRKTFQDMIAANKRNSAILMAAMTILLVGLGAVFGGAYDDIGAGVVIALIVTGVMFLFSWFAAGDAIMAFSGAHEIEKADAPQLFNVVEEMSLAAGLPMPRIFIIDSGAPNAFATGISPDKASVAITTGLLEKLNRDELQGVMAHELGHIRNFDIRYSLLMSVLAGGVVLLSDIFLRATFITGGRRRSNDRDNGGLQAVLLIAGIILAILAPLFAALIQMAMSRQREYLADASAVEFTRNPDGLANALEKLASDRTPMDSCKATEHMYIVSPKLGLRGGADTLFSTHPPIEERIERIRSLKG